MTESFVYDFSKSFTLKEFDALPLPEQSVLTKSKSSSCLHPDSRQKQSWIVLQVCLYGDIMGSVLVML